jgi:hypothetical protein
MSYQAVILSKNILAEPDLTDSDLVQISWLNLSLQTVILSRNILAEPDLTDSDLIQKYLS